MGKLCRSLVLDRTHQTRWTTGKLRRVNASLFTAICQYDVHIIAVATGETAATLKADPDSADDVHDVVVDPLLRFAVTSHVSQLLRLWVQSEDEWEVAAQWKCPGKFPAFVQLDPDAQILACVTAGQNCFLYRVATQTCLKRYEIPKGLISAMAFDSAGHLWIGDQTGALTMIDFEKKAAKRIAADDAHHSVVTGIVSLPPHVVTGGQDEVVLVFDTAGNVALTPIALYYRISAIVADPSDEAVVIVATDNGVKRVDVPNCRIGGVSSRIVDQLFYFERLYGFSADGIIRTIRAKEPHALALAFFEVYDVAYEATSGAIAAVTSAPSFAVSLLQGGNVQQLLGHTNTPLALAAQGDLLMSGSKDGTARIWSLGDGRCLTVLLGHSESVLAVAFVPGSDTVLTASSDRTVKLWRPLDSPETRSALSSLIAHDRDVTALSVSLDGHIIATASLDKTAKLWQLEDDRVSPLFTLGGHRRGVTAVAFSTIEKVLATGGSDNAVKLWAVDDGSCLATFTEFGGTIAALSFVRSGVQLLVGESRGAVKVVRVKTGTTDFTVDAAHSGQLWNVIATDDGLGAISCGTDGKICVWHDNTEELEEQERAAKDEAAADEQALKNALRGAEYITALRLAFKLRMPNKLRLVVREISERQSNALVEYFGELEDIPDYEQWLDYVSKWATNSRWTDDATEVITALLRVRPLSFFTKHRKAFEAKIDAVIPYLDRHFGRLDRLSIQAYAIDEVLDSGDVR